uniref:40S ribosomal protein S12 n=1 Tax=Eptatretus burgeri TaxID=7764 RepID=A0A8C4R375_EPTBU
MAVSQPFSPIPSHRTFSHFYCLPLSIIYYSIFPFFSFFRRHLRENMAEAEAIGGGSMDVNSALQEVLKTALITDGLARGLRESAKALDKRQAHLCVLAGNCDEPMYVKLVEALCNEHQINLIKVDDNKKLGEWAGLCKIDREGKPRKVVGCSCVVVKDYGKETQAKDVLEEYFKAKK